MKILSVVGARPNFMKIAPFIRAIEDYNQHNSDKIEHILVHTGQHYDDNMSKAFFRHWKSLKPTSTLVWARAAMPNKLG